MKALVIGGTRFFGKLIVEGLLEKGYHVSVYTRGNLKPSFSRSVKHIRGDRTEHSSFVSQMEKYDFDVVVDNIAYAGRHVESIREVFEGRIRRYILTSSAAVYRVLRVRSPVKEDDARIELPPEIVRQPESRHRYSIGKREAEKVLFQTMGSDGEFPFTIIRPPIVQGAFDPSLRPYFWIQRVLDGGPILMPEGGVYPFRHVYSADLANAYILALESEKAVNRAYNVAQEEILTLREYVESLCSVLDKEFKPVDIPSAFAEKSVGYDPPYFRRSILIPSIQRAKSELGYSSTPFEKWLEQTARWFAESYRGPDSRGYERRQDEIQLAKAWTDKREEIGEHLL